MTPASRPATSRVSSGVPSRGIQSPRASAFDPTQPDPTHDACMHAVRELRERGLDNPDQFLEFATPEAIHDTCRWFDAQHGRIGPGVLVNELRAGGKVGWRSRRSLLDEQREYGTAIVSWVEEKLPDLCRVDARIIEWERRLYGDVLADRLERSTASHPAAIAAVLRLHHRFGKGQLTVRAHGREIRAAVEAANDRAVADYEAISVSNRLGDPFEIPDASEYSLVAET